MDIINRNSTDEQVGGAVGCTIACVGGCLLVEVVAAAMVATYSLS